MTDRLALGIKWVQFGAFAASVALVLLALPLDSMMQALRTWIEGLGSWAPLVFAVTYGIAATLFIPASALSLAAGVMFGVWLGTAAVWFGATIAIVLSFLIARYAARSRVEAIARENPRFAAIDRAIGEQGWRIVALMRLSPVFPFTLQNYLFGVSAIRFWPCCIASAAFIVPGTFMYVYIGYAGGEAAAAVGGSEQIDALKMALQLAGLVATVVVTVIVARIAAKAIAKHAPDESVGSVPAAANVAGVQPTAKRPLTLALAVACLLVGLAAYINRESIRDMFFPPNQIENVLTRPSFLEDRIHFALVCAAPGCPKLRMEAYRGDAIDEQLRRQAEQTNANERWFRYEEVEGRVWLTRAHGWYSGDFIQIHASRLVAAGRYSPRLLEDPEASRDIRFRWLPNDWALNIQSRDGNGALSPAHAPET